MSEQEQVISLQAKTGKAFIVKVKDSTITEIISVDGKKPESKILPDGFYQTEGGLSVRVKNNKLYPTQAGVKPRAIRVPLSPIAQVMARKQQERKKEISSKRIAGKI
ncbi:MAG: hypothetical protein KF860_17330 [Cyclobacteriaceae bacterium]|nr:hypothetical protein [Cyclobacteriaceae bacterium]